MKYDVPGEGEIELKTLILDLNGTLSVGGKIVSGSKERLKTLAENGVNIVLFTGNTRGDADEIASELGIEWRQAKNAEEKAVLARGMEPETCITIGNGRIDAELVEACRLGVVTLQAEGVHTKTLQAADVVVPSFIDALDLLIDPDRLIATLRS